MLPFWGAEYANFTGSATSARPIIASHHQESPWPSSSLRSRTPPEAQAGGRPRKIVRLPITASVLRGIQGPLSLRMGQDSTAFWAIAVVAFFGLFRLGELLLESGITYNSVLHLSWGDISIDSLTNPSMVKVHAPQFGAGACRCPLRPVRWPVMSCHRNIGLYQRPKGHAWLCFRGQPGETDFQSTVHSRSPGGLKRIGLSYTINMQATASALERQQRQP